MATRIVRDTHWNDGRRLAFFPATHEDGEMVIVVQDERGVEGGKMTPTVSGGSFPVKKVLEAIYEAAPDFAPDGWKPTPGWADARVIEGTDCDGDRRVLVRAYANNDQDAWVTDAAIHWSQSTAEAHLTDIRILVGAGD